MDVDLLNGILRHSRLTALSELALQLLQDLLFINLECSPGEELLNPGQKPQIMDQNLETLDGNLKLDRNFMLWMGTLKSWTCTLSVYRKSPGLNHGLWTGTTRIHWEFSNYGWESQNVDRNPSAQNLVKKKRFLKIVIHSTQYIPCRQLCEDGRRLTSQLSLTFWYLLAPRACSGRW